MPEDNESFNQLMQDQLILLEALYEVFHQSNEAEITRMAIGALVRTQSGVNYLVAHPITL